MGRTQVIVEGPKGEKCLVDLCDTDEQMKRITVRQLKKKIIEKLPETPDPDDISLIFIDKRLNEDDRTLSFYGVEHMSVILMVFRVKGGGGGPLEPHGGGRGDRDGHHGSMERLTGFYDDGSGAAGGP